MITLIIVVVSAIPGALFSMKLARWRVSPKASLACAILIFSLSLLLAYFFCYKPAQKDWVYVIAPMVGVGNGWIYPAQRNLLIGIIPGGCEAEMMGLLQFVSAIWGWLPPLVFLSLSEATGTLRHAILVGPLFWLTGLAFLSRVDLAAAQSKARETLHLRNFSAHPAEKAALPTESRVELAEVEMSEAQI